jgi:hypothetical protein
MHLLLAVDTASLNKYCLEHTQSLFCEVVMRFRNISLLVVYYMGFMFLQSPTRDIVFN